MSNSGCPSVSMFSRHMHTWFSRVCTMRSSLAGLRLPVWRATLPSSVLANWAVPSAPGWAGKVQNSWAGVKKEGIKPCCSARTDVWKWVLTRVWQSGWYTDHSDGRYQVQPAENSTGCKLGKPSGEGRGSTLWQETCWLCPAGHVNSTNNTMSVDVQMPKADSSSVDARVRVLVGWSPLAPNL